MKVRAKIVSALLVTFIATSCSNTWLYAGSKESPQTVSIESIQNQPEKYLNRRVSINGSFMGWQGGCQSPPPVTRSDWMIEDGTGCIYVSGRLPDGRLNSFDPKGEKIKIEGIVKKGDFEAYYLEIR